MARTPTKQVKNEKPTTIGAQLRRLRKARGLTQTELGMHVGVTQRVITYYENEGGSLSPELLAKLAAALRVSADQLLGYQRPTLQHPEAVPPENLRLWRRLKRVEELPPQDRKTVLKMIDALADRASKRN